jgi:hypothetical protein
MGTRWFNSVVVLFWLGTMGWLVTSKILPPMMRGDPPTYQATLPAEGEQAEIVGWTVHWNGRRIGNAASAAERDDDVTTTTSRVALESLPLNEILPMLGHLVKMFSGRGNLQGIDVRTRMNFAYGGLHSFRSTIRVAELPDRFELRGTVKGTELALELKLGSAPSHRVKTVLPPDAIVSEQFAPLAQLRGIHLGQTWTVPVCSPMNPGRPLEILQAKVESEERLVWNGREQMVWVVVYRDDAGTSSAARSRDRTKMWVAHDGRVLQQEIFISGGLLRFVRASGDHAEQLRKFLKEH